MGIACSSPRAKHVAQLGGAVCTPAPDPSHVGGPSTLAQGEHRGLYLFAAKALVVIWYQACCSRDSLAPVPQSVMPEHYAPIRVWFQAILVNPGNLSLFDCRTGNPTQSGSIHHYYILLHIIKNIFTFNSKCSLKFASRNLIGLPILMPLIDTNRLLQVQVDSEVNSDLSQVLVED